MIIYACDICGKTVRTIKDGSGSMDNAEYGLHLRQKQGTGELRLDVTYEWSSSPQGGNKSSQAIVCTDCALEWIKQELERRQK
jgi:hypothetical protein